MKEKKTTLRRLSKPYALSEGVPDDHNRTGRKVPSDAGSGANEYGSHPATGDGQQTESKYLKTGKTSKDDHALRRVRRRRAKRREEPGHSIANAF